MARAATARRLLGQILKEQGVISEGQIQEALLEQRRHGGPIGSHLVARGACTNGDVARALAVQAGLELVDLTRTSPSPEALLAIDATTAHAFGVLPLVREGNRLLVALADPLNTALLEDLAFTTGLEVRGALAEAEALRALVKKHYGEEQSLADAVRDAARADVLDPNQAASSAPVVRLLTSILQRAIKDRASDVHFEVYGADFRIRYRVDGALYEVEAPPAHLAPALIARIKVLSDLDIAETKLPQDGRISLVIEGRPVDLRVATLPAVAGEGAVLRVLDRSSVSLDLDALGFELEQRRTLSALTHLPSGIVLITGPTGSGKTTTLYALLAEVNDPSIKIITVEDPVEYDIDGIVQIPINEEIGVDYGRVLRTVLRQDPDKILVGEIRDAETASVAIEASLTGHTVFATVHTNDAPSAVTRLLDLGLEPYLLTATLEAIVAQRLVRKVCANCRVEYVPEAEDLLELGPSAEALVGRTLVYGKGCVDCFHTGYRGRTALVEVLVVDDSVRQAVLAGASTGELRRLARRFGMRTLREAGLAAVVLGRTTLDEVMRETADLE